MTWVTDLTPVDYILIVIVLMAFTIGWARGLVASLAGFLAFIIATFVAGRYTGVIVDYANRNWAAQQRLAGMLERRLALPAETYKVPSGAIPWQRAIEWLNALPLPEEYRRTLAERISEWSQAGGSQTAASFITQQVAAGVLSAMVFFLLALVVGWGLALVARLISDQLNEIPIVGTANRAMGAAMTVFETAVVLALLVGLLIPVLSVYGAGKLHGLVADAKLTPNLLAFFEWLRTVVFGMAKGAFFAS